MTKLISAVCNLALAISVTAQGAPDIALKVPGHRSPPTLSLSSDGHYGVTFDDTTAIKLWNADTGEHLITDAREAATATTGHCLWTENSLLVADTTLLKIVALPGRNTLRSVVMPDFVRSVTISPDGLKAVCALPNRVVVVNLATMALEKSVTTGITTNVRLGVSFDASLFAIRSSNGFAVYSTIDGLLKGSVTTTVSNLTMSPDGNLVAVQRTGGTEAIVLDWRTNQPLASLPTPERGSTGVDWSSNGNFVATSGIVTRLWSTADWSLAATYLPADGLSFNPRFSPGSDKLFLAERSGAATVLSVPTLAPEKSFGRIGGSWLGASYSTDGSLAACSGDETVVVVDPVTGQRKARFVTSGAYSVPGGTSFAWLNGRRSLVFAKSNGALSVGDVDTGIVSPFFLFANSRSSLPIGTVTLAAVPGTNRVLASNSNTLYLLNTAQRRVVWSKPLNFETPALTCSPDGQWFVLHRIGSFIVGRVSDGSIVRTFTDGSSYSCAFTPDSQQFAIAGLTGRIDLYDTTTWSVARSLQTGIELVVSIAFTADGKKLAVSGNTALLGFLDASTGQLIAKYDQEVFKVWAMCYSNDGSRMFVARTDGMAYFVNVP